jgi:hypothetical protein
VSPFEDEFLGKGTPESLAGTGDEGDFLTEIGIWGHVLGVGSGGRYSLQKSGICGGCEVIVEVVECGGIVSGEEVVCEGWIFWVSFRDAEGAIESVEGEVGEGIDSEVF